MKIHSLFILKSSGVCLYSRNFTDEFKNLDLHLITPFFSAIFTFSQKVISRKLEELEMSGLRFTFKVVDDFIFTLLTDTSVSLLFVSTRLETIAKAFFKMYDQLGKFKEFQEIENAQFDKLIDEIITGEEEIFKDKDFYNKIIELFKNLIFENEIIGAALLSTKGNIIYSSLPTEILLSSLKELEIRFMARALDLPELFYSLPNGQKVFYRIMFNKKSNLNLLIVLLFESSVPLGMAEVLLFKITRNIEKLIIKEKKKEKTKEIFQSS
ncbi:MAG: hypothetical protein ACFFAN_11870 [Promethearchaeota archaeon]